MPFTPAFLLCDVNSALPKVVNPSPSFGDGAQQGVPTDFSAGLAAEGE
jgi:hypothetical protein